MRDIVKHIALGGYWYDNTKKSWVCAGPFVAEYMNEHPEQKKYLGLAQPSSIGTYNF
jgi:hypothetical protein